MRNMDKTKLQTLKGFRDFLPKEAKKRQYTLEIIKDTFDLFGFEPLETPSLEYHELLAGKYGEEGNKLMYSFTDHGGRKVALRYDQTVPTARVLASHQNDLAIPFRRYQIQPAWRADKPQSGRFRELLQCDADIYGTTSALADAELVALADKLFQKLGFTKHKIYINDRKILHELMRYANIPQELQLAAISLIDKLDRRSREEIVEELKKAGLTDESIDHLFHHMDEATPTEDLVKVMDYANELGVKKENIEFQVRLARGLDYYTGTIFEIKIDGYKAGSVLGGGRYDDLIETLSGVSIPAVGFALGFDRTMEAMEQFNLLPSDKKRAGTLVSVFNEKLRKDSMMAVTELRMNNVPSELYPDDNVELKKQLKYADKKGIKWFIVIGPEEMEKEKLILKDLETGHQEELKISKAVQKISGEK